MAGELGARQNNIILFASDCFKSPDLSQLAYGVLLAARTVAGSAMWSSLDQGDERKALEDSGETYLIPETYMKKWAHLPPDTVLGAQEA